MNCMKAFLNTTKKETKSDKVTTLFWKKFECEICTHPLPLSVTVNDEKLSLVNYDLPEEPHMVLESQEHLSKIITQRMIHIIKAQSDDEEFSIGCD